MTPTPATVPLPARWSVRRDPHPGGWRVVTPGGVTRYRAASHAQAVRLAHALAGVDELLARAHQHTGGTPRLVLA